ncbi:bifunctional riboflavin kinase/FAD synthetase [Adhaeribacter sp. BT258]|uniref:Riboflavin biosynthesis protein n=1 Tax=Adhaeribacter terrigena TaxID=2793070 RepID=A0ABS1C2U2_9BACT|nr:bifunctional riboflavin kinase/FAD synthetase [Adhaeribacter terrigena]MBK0403723.1 bifunctional riboflavin kinase/FAD synthetase [Adhaeribacter terrigena]
MEVIRELHNFPKIANAVVTSGTFDGVHVGHQQILKRLHENAMLLGGKSVVITFWPHPRHVLSQSQEKPVYLLTSIEERIALLRKFKVDYLLIIPFTPEFANLSSSEFIQKILIEAIGTKKLVIGYDHRFGRNREGGFEYLKENAATLGFEVEEIPREDVDHVGVSSTKIRKALEAGDIETANKYLGYPYLLTGTVAEGDRLGRTIGFPTANLEISETQKLIPARGVYAVYGNVNGQKLKGMLNIGMRPTVGGLKQTIETHFFHFDQDIYHQELQLELVARLRDEQKFPGLEALKAQLVKDQEAALAVL